MVFLIRCLVTGNHGYIGYIMANQLLKAGYDVVGYDCDYFERECFGREDAFKAAEGIKQITKDIRDVTREDFRGIDAVIHLAALPNDPVGDLNPEVTYDIDYLGTMQLAIAAKRSGVKRFIFASTCSVFGQKGSNPVNEKSRPSPITPYGIAKMYAEDALIPMSSEKFAVSCMRNATCYGVSPRMRFDMILNVLVASAFTQGKIRLLNDGHPWRPQVHIEDVANAYMLALEADVSDVSGEIFSVGSENFRSNELATLVSKLIPESELVYEEWNKDPRSYRVSFKKIREVLGFSAKWSTKSGVKELYEAYKKFGLNKENFQDKRFWAGKYFKHLIESKKINDDMKLVHLVKD